MSVISLHIALLLEPTLLSELSSLGVSDILTSLCLRLLTLYLDAHNLGSETKRAAWISRFMAIDMLIFPLLVYFELTIDLYANAVVSLGLISFQPPRVLDTCTSINIFSPSRISATHFRNLPEKALRVSPFTTLIYLTCDHLLQSPAHWNFSLQWVPLF